MAQRRRLRRDVDPHSIQDSLGSVARSMGMAHSETIVGVVGNWERVVGPVVAQHVVPVQIRGKTLLLEVTDPNWSTQVRYLESEMLETIAREVGPDLINKISIRVKRSDPQK